MTPTLDIGEILMNDSDLNNTIAALSDVEMSSAARDLNIYETTGQVQGKFRGLVEEYLSTTDKTQEAVILVVRDALTEDAVFRWGRYDTKTFELDTAIRALSDDELAGAMRDLNTFEMTGEVEGKFQALIEEFFPTTNEAQEAVLISVPEALEAAAVFRWGVDDARTLGQTT